MSSEFKKIHIFAASKKNNVVMKNTNKFISMAALRLKRNCELAQLANENHYAKIEEIIKMTRGDILARIMRSQLDHRYRS